MSSWKYRIFSNLCLGVVAMLFGVRDVRAQCIWDSIVQNLSAKTEARSQRAAANLRDLCVSVKPADIQNSESAKKCLGTSTPVFSETDKNILLKALGTLSSSTMKKLFPTVVGLLASPVAGAITAFLTPEVIGKDAIDTISNPQRNSKDDLMKASRALVWDTDPPAFHNLSAERKAAIEACIIAR